MVQEKSREGWPTSTHGFTIYPCSGEVPQALLPGELTGFVGLAQRWEEVG
jgi:hypothetical protein